MMSILNYFPLKNAGNSKETEIKSSFPNPSGDLSRDMPFLRNCSCKQYGKSDAVGFTKKEICSDDFSKIGRKLPKLE